MGESYIREQSTMVEKTKIKQNKNTKKDAGSRYDLRNRKLYFGTTNQLTVNVTDFFGSPFGSLGYRFLRIVLWDEEGPYWWESRELERGRWDPCRGRSLSSLPLYF